MYTTKNRIDGNDTGTLPATANKSGNSIKPVIGARGYRNGGEPFHIRKVSRRLSIWGRENLLEHATWYLKNYSHLCYTETYITVKPE
jgi:hypothetical protein